MGTIFSTIMIVAPVAFLVGWLLSKAMFRHLSVLRPNAAANELRPDGREILKAAFDRSEGDSANSAEPDAAEMHAQLIASHKRISALRAEISLLKEGVAEGEHTIHDLKSKLSEQLSAPEDAPAAAAGKEAAFRRLLKAQQDRVSQRDGKIKDLQQQLTRAEENVERVKKRFRVWRERIKPLASQFRQQRMIISELRDELRQRAEQQRLLEESQVAQVAPVPASTPVVTEAPIAKPALLESASARNDRDNLQTLRGIGPALQKQLHAFGVYRFQQFADMSPAELLRLCDALGISANRMQKFDWVKQARQQLGYKDPAPAKTATAPAVAVV